MRAHTTASLPAVAVPAAWRCVRYEGSRASRCGMNTVLTEQQQLDDLVGRAATQRCRQHLIA